MSSYESAWRRVIGEERPGGWVPLARAGLSACAAAYGAGLRLYRGCYDLGLVKVTRLPCPVIGVGNLTLGGTGKTTTVTWLAQHLRQLGRSPAILSRGYGSENDAAVTLVADREGIRASVAESGDEPQMLARAVPGVPVLVGRNRRLTGAVAFRDHGATVCLLDDAFQYWRLAKDLEIVLIDANRPPAGEALFPRGILREPLAALRRAGMVLLTHADRAPAGQPESLRADLLRRFPDLVVAETRHRPAGLRPLAGEATPMTAELFPGRWLAISSLGDPASFPRTLAAIGLKAEHVPFPDHHVYREAEVRTCAARAEASGCCGVLTTEKDAVKLHAAWFGALPAWVVAVELEFLRGQEQVEERLRRCVDQAG
jgi:tetraacyldisaccharide 4'-kinase